MQIIQNGKKLSRLNFALIVASSMHDFILFANCSCLPDWIGTFSCARECDRWRELYFNYGHINSTFSQVHFFALIFYRDAMRWLLTPEYRPLCFAEGGARRFPNNLCLCVKYDPILSCSLDNGSPPLRSLDAMAGPWQQTTSESVARLWCAPTDI